MQIHPVSHGLIWDQVWLGECSLGTLEYFAAVKSLFLVLFPKPLALLDLLGQTELIL